MTDREKLIWLIRNGRGCPEDANPFDNENCLRCKYFSSVDCDIERLADNLLANGVTFGEDTDVPGKWIPVSERLPENRDYVLVCTKNKFYGTRHISKVSKAYFGDGKWYGQGGCWTNVTHWMPMPQPPKEG